MLKYSYTIVIKGCIDDKSIFIIFISYKLYSSHLSFVSIYFVPFIAKSAEIRSLFSLLLKASLKCLQSMNMRSKGWASDIYCMGRLKLLVLAIKLEFLDFTKRNFWQKFNCHFMEFVQNEL